MSDFSLSIRPKHDRLDIQVRITYALLFRWIVLGFMAISLTSDTPP